MGRNLLDIQMVMEEAIGSFYSWPLMIILNIGFVWIVVTRRKKVPGSNALLVFGIGALFQDFVGITGIWLVQENHSVKQQDIYYGYAWVSAMVFAVINALTPYSFFYNRLPREKTRKQIAFFRNTFLVLSIGLMLLANIKLNHWPDLENYVGNYIALSALFALIPSFYYFNFLFTSFHIDRLVNDPAWWVMCGYIALNATIIPLMLMIKFVYGTSSMNIYAIAYLLFCALFILFSRAFYCKPKGNEKIEVKEKIHRSHE